MCLTRIFHNTETQVHRTHGMIPSKDYSDELIHKLIGCLIEVVSMCIPAERKLRTTLLVVSSVLFQISHSATVDTVSIYSGAMHKAFNCVVIKPDSYKKKKPFPVVYLLHGSSGDFANCIKRVPAIKNYADKYNMLIVCPDGGQYSWYLDSPVDSSMKYETYIGSEVPSYIET